MTGLENACPECGSHVVARDGKVMTIQLPHGYPFDNPCRTCWERAKKQMENLGQELAQEREEKLMRELMKHIRNR